MTRRSRVPPASTLVGATFLATGLAHFARPRTFEAIVPGWLPAHRELVLASGVAELAGGLGVLHPRTRGVAGAWLVATLVAVFPANVEMAVHAERFPAIPAPVLWARLPLQAVLVAWVWRATRARPRRTRRRPARGLPDRG